MIELKSTKVNQLSSLQELTVAIRHLGKTGWVKLLMSHPDITDGPTSYDQLIIGNVEARYLSWMPDAGETFRELIARIRGIFLGKMQHYPMIAYRSTQEKRGFERGAALLGGIPQQSKPRARIL